MVLNGNDSSDCHAINGGDDWFLEHVTTKKRILLVAGENIIGRHSCCRIVLNEHYDFISRQHINIIVDSTGVRLRPMNAMNGVFHNGERFDVGERAAREGDKISLSIKDPEDPVPARHGVFILKKTLVLGEEIVLTSDDDDDTEPLPPEVASKASANKNVEFNLSEQLPNFIKREEPDALGEEPTSSKLHLPKLSDVKEEGVSQVSNNIEDIFGKPDEQILDAVLQLNPYVYNKLSNTSSSTVVGNKMMHDGDRIELKEEMPPPANPPPVATANPPTLPPSPPNDDYDENMVMSQVVLQGMKEEMALDDFDIDFDDDFDDFLDNKVKLEESNLPASNVFSEWDEDEIIVIEDDDEESYNKVADWSLKLLTQNNAEMLEMSQAYPLENADEENSDDDEVIQIAQQSHRMRIDSSSSEDSVGQGVGQEEESTTDTRRCTVRLKSISPKDLSSPGNDEDSTLFTRREKLPTMHEEITACLNRENALTEKPSLFQRRQQIIEDKTDEKDKIMLENKEVVEAIMLDICSTTSDKNSVEDLASTSAIIKSKKSPVASGDDSDGSEHKLADDVSSKTSRNKCSASRDAKSKKSTIRKRSATIASRVNLSMGNESSPKKQISSSSTATNDAPKESQMRQRAKSVSSRKELIPNEDIPIEELQMKINRVAFKCKTREDSGPEGVNEEEKLLAQKDKKEKELKETTKAGSLSSHLDQEQPKICSSGPRGPVVVIDAPFLPTGRGKLRGVSAGEISAKSKILQRQKSLDCQAEMKSKWYQKPKDKKKDDEKLRQTRKEVLKKLANDEKPKESTSAQKRKFNNTKVPKVNHTNRGAFLTETSATLEAPPPLSKKAKLSAKPALPSRRNTTETFSQQLQAANEAYVPSSSASISISSSASSSAKPSPKLPVFPSRRETTDSSSEELQPPNGNVCQSAVTSTSARRPPERRDAAIARGQRTCNRVTFASMEREFELRKQLNKQARSQRHVRFNLKPQIRYIERVRGTHSKYHKDALKQYSSTYQDRSEWSRKLYNKRKGPIDFIQSLFLKWSNEWLKVRSADVVAQSDVLVSIPNEFKTYRQYKDTFVPLMKLELLTTVERDYKQSTINFEIYLKSFTKVNDRYRLVTRTNTNTAWYTLYTLSNENKLKEMFALLLDKPKKITENSSELIFWILQDNIQMKQLSEIKHLTARAVVDHMRVEFGAFEALYQLGCSPLFHRILTPSENVQRVAKPMSVYKGYIPINEHQREICMQTGQRVVDDGNASITLIQGPPGTGKSVVISNLCLQCLYGDTTNKLDRKILICAHSNTAVDNITRYLNTVRRKMSRDKFEFLRFGLYDKMSDDCRSFSLEPHLRWEKTKKLERFSVEQLMQLRSQLSELKTEINQLQQQNNLSARLQQQLEQKEKQYKHIQDQLNPPLTNREEFEICKKIIYKANIVCTTLSSCVKLSRFINYFDICIIDEATQCTEPWTLLPLRFAVNHLVLVGDTQQLPATVISQKAQDFGLANSMFDRIQRCLKDQLDKPGGASKLVHTKIFKLSTQYRMHPEICRWPNRYFYEEQLVNSDRALRRPQSPIIPYCVINLSFTRDTNDISTRSISNDKEAGFVVQLLIEMDKHMPTKQYSYGIMSPYSNQCYALSQLIPKEMKITPPTTVDSYQGLEKDVIIISNARTRGCGFLTNYQRLNVALTRAKRCLIICGNFDDLQSVDLWRALLNDARDRGVYFDLQREQTKDLRKSLMPKLLTKNVPLQHKP